MLKGKSENEFLANESRKRSDERRYKRGRGQELYWRMNQWKTKEADAPGLIWRLKLMGSTGANMEARADAIGRESQVEVVSMPPPLRNAYTPGPQRRVPCNVQAFRAAIG